MKLALVLGKDCLVESSQAVLIPAYSLGRIDYGRKYLSEPVELNRFPNFLCLRDHLKLPIDHYLVSQADSAAVLLGSHMAELLVSLDIL